jgi:Leucine-rich repeat (LRR) protein
MEEDYNADVLPDSVVFNWEGKQLTNNHIDVLIREFQNHSVLKSINLSWNNIDFEAVIKISKSICSIPTLTSLNLRCTRFAEIKEYHSTSEVINAENKQNFISHLQRASSITNLYLSNNYIDGTLGIPLLLLSNLQVLDLSWNELDRRFAYQLGENLPVLKLIDINVSWNLFEAPGALDIVRNIEKNTCLQKLSLNGSKIDDEYFSLIVQKISLNSSLDYLALSCNNIGSASMGYVQQLFRHPSLKKLDLNNNQILLNDIIPPESKVGLIRRSNQQPN